MRRVPTIAPTTMPTISASSVPGPISMVFRETLTDCLSEARRTQIDVFVVDVSRPACVAVDTGRPMHDGADGQ